MLVLGIETSCDETAASVVSADRTILSNVVFSQLKEHQAYGGVVPEIAARSHITHIEPIVQRALQEADVSLQDLDGIAATGGPGLIGGVIVGTTFAKALAYSTDKPFVAVNHLEGHALTARLTHGLDFPYLLLLASGGHCQLLLVKGLGDYEKLGGTLDDAAGEAFDKVAKLLDLGHPGGPAVERMAATGDPTAFDLPRPLKGQKNFNFSFSGLKTAVARLDVSQKQRADLCASFQQAVCDVFEDRVRRALKHAKPPAFVVAGGVASNQKIRETLEMVCVDAGVSFVAPPINLCTDNGAMIAWTGLEYLQQKIYTSLDFKPRPRWPLEELK